MRERDRKKETEQNTKLEEKQQYVEYESQV